MIALLELTHRWSTKKDILIRMKCCVSKSALNTIETLVPSEGIVGPRWQTSNGLEGLERERERERERKREGGGGGRERERNGRGLKSEEKFHTHVSIKTSLHIPHWYNVNSHA